MKKFTVLSLVAILLMTAFYMTQDDAVSAEKPKGTRYSSTYSFSQVVDSTVAVQRDTFTNVGKFTGIDDYGNLEGYWVIEYTSVDTGAGGVYVDTTKDSLFISLITYGEGGTPSKVIYTDTSLNYHVSASVVNGDYVIFDVSDSTLLDYVSFQIISTLQDSTYIQAAAEAAINYRFTYKLYAK